MLSIAAIGAGSINSGDPDSGTTKSPIHQRRVADEPLVGLWSAYRQFNTAYSGDVVVRSTDGGLVAEAGQYRVPVVGPNESVRFEMPNGKGRFVGRRDGSRIIGHWIQPASYQAFAEMATPLELEEVGPGIWSGRIDVLPDEIIMYINLRDCDGGRVCGHLRNPEVNIGRFYEIHDVKLTDNNDVEFEDSGGDVILSGHYDPEWDLLSVFFPFGGGYYDFTRTTGDRYQPYYPSPDTT